MQSKKLFSNPVSKPLVPTHTYLPGSTFINFYEVLSTKLKSMLLFPHPPILTQKEAYYVHLVFTKSLLTFFP